MKIEKCKWCGSRKFLVNEEYTHEGEISEDDEKKGLMCKDVTSEIRNIECANCGKIYKYDDFNTVEFC